MEDKIVELKHELVEKDEHILKLEKINYKTQKKMAELQKKVIELENRAEGIDLSPVTIESATEIKQLKLKLKRREQVLKDIKKKMDILKNKLVQKPDQKQLEVMKQAITKIRSLQSELKLKNSKIAEFRDQFQEINRKMTRELEKKDLIIKTRDEEIQKLENEFISFKEEFVQELNTLERQKETISMKKLMDSKKDLEIERDKFQEIIVEKNEMITKLEKDIKSLKLMLESRDNKIDELEKKVDNLLLDDESTKTLQSKIKLVEDEYKEKLRIRAQELEKTREEIILVTSELVCAVPDLSAEEILEYVDDIMLLAPEYRNKKIKEIKTSKVIDDDTSIVKDKSEVSEEKLANTANLETESHEKMTEEPINEIKSEISEQPNEEVAEEVIEEPPLDQAISPTPEENQEDKELRELINTEIPGLSEIEKVVFIEELRDSPPEERHSKIELFKMTKELEMLKKGT
ncbi:MAG: hypothetical protein ACTSRG_24820 [Candidatus Helarchaeota archaeon]